jgi:hypothetical protein
MLELEDPGADSELQRIFLWYTRAKGRTAIGPNDKVGGTDSEICVGYKCEVGHKWDISGTCYCLVGQ